MHRFGQLQSELGVATNVLTNRLERLVEAGILERLAYQHRPTRYEYVFTAQGSELILIVLALKVLGDRHLQPAGPWTRVQHRGCTAPIAVGLTCPDCGEQPAPSEIETVMLRSG